ncbi:MAG TPA: threonine--tRNA ligase [Elusimicrobia bacterium]|nr:threonine--tRNA ligase [Elusimicrobiota bacterium]HBT60863.1 threonine--tRNA ligase [Elusimicrobiota bacterium]
MGEPSKTAASENARACALSGAELETMRHSTAHVLAQAVVALFPGTKLGIGPAIENGFYYDFDCPHHFVPEDLPRIEERMRQIVAEGQPFLRRQASKAEAHELLSRAGEKLKLELLADLKDDAVTFYDNGPFTDMCRGPHVADTGQIRHFKLTSIAGAYWRGDEKRPMLQRLYGIAFSTAEELEAHLKLQEEAAKRDHRRLGKSLGIFFFDEDVGPGLPLWLPNGAVIIEELESLAKSTEAAAGYLRVKTPHICKESMYLRSGHLPYYQDSMFPPMEFEGVKYYLKPMNCPHHHKIFASELRSYRDLPLRLAEYGTCYRYEQSGELFGLMRVRSMQMNDAHIYCGVEQFEEEFLAVCRMYLEYFRIFGIDKYVMRLSLHGAEGLGKKYVNEPELWKRTEEMVLRAVKHGGIEYVSVPNEAAFYGPKIDVQVWSAIGKEFTLATNQVDFAVPRRFELTYRNREGREETPLCIHRAPLGTHERFVGFLLEHYAGVFPLWLSPVQVKILTVSMQVIEPAARLAKSLESAGLRARLDARDEKVGAKVRDATMEKVPYMVVLGPKDVVAGALSVRLRDGRQVGGVKEDEFVARLKREISEKRATPSW